MKIKMYKRPNGTYGIRNRIAVIPTVACVNHIAQSIAEKIPSADAYTHPYGCDQLGSDGKLSFDCLKAMGIHPNNGAVLVVGLGCEEIIPNDLYKAIKAQQPNTKCIVMQEIGGTTKTVETGVEICRKFEEILTETEKVETNISNLTVGLECGGSDFTSGIASNPSLGIFAEKLCSLGGKIVFGETTELMGAEDIIKDLCEKEEIYDFIVSKIKKVEKTAIDMKVDLRGTQPSVGNIEGGLTTIEEKSLGGICKIGSNKIVDAVEFGSKATKSGVTFVDTPGNDIACTLGLCTAGAQLIIFTTGRGTPMGFAAAPVIKVTANSAMAKLMEENIDIDLSDIVEGKSSVSDGGEKVFEKVVSVANGEEACAEKLGHREFSLYRISPILT